MHGTKVSRGAGDEGRIDTKRFYSGCQRFGPQSARHFGIHLNDRSAVQEGYTLPGKMIVKSFVDEFKKHGFGAGLKLPGYPFNQIAIVKRK